MTGPCLCGDPYCPSCGPAQGFDPDWMRFLDGLGEKFQWLMDVDCGGNAFEEVFRYVFDAGYKQAEDRQKEADADDANGIDMFMSELEESHVFDSNVIRTLVERKLRTIVNSIPVDVSKALIDDDNGEFWTKKIIGSVFGVDTLMADVIVEELKRVAETEVPSSPFTGAPYPKGTKYGLVDRKNLK